MFRLSAWGGNSGWVAGVGDGWQGQLDGVGGQTLVGVWWVDASALDGRGGRAGWAGSCRWAGWVVVMERCVTLGEYMEDGCIPVTWVTGGRVQVISVGG